MATAPIKIELATEAAQVILQGIIEDAPRQGAAGLKTLAEAYAAVMGTSRSDTPAKAPVRLY